MWADRVVDAAFVCYKEVTFPLVSIGRPVSVGGFGSHLAARIPGSVPGPQPGSVPGITPGNSVCCCRLAAC